MMVKLVRLLHGACGVSASDLVLTAEAVYLYPHFFCEIMGFFIRIPHGDGDKVFWSSVVRQLAVADGSSSPVLIKMVVDVRSMLMMRLRVGAGREILLHFQCLTPLMKDGGGH
jgi:hypothetical protein